MAGVANQDNRGGRTGVCAPRTSFPANVYSRLYLMDLSLEYGTVTVVVHGSGSDDTTYPPDGAANQDNRSGRTGVCAPRTCLPANVNSQSQYSGGRR